MFPSHGAFGIHTLDASRKSGGLLLGINYQPSPVQRCNIADFFSPTVSLTKYSKLLKPLGRAKSYVFWTVAMFRKFWILTHKRHKSSDRCNSPIDRHRGWVKKCLEVNLTVLNFAKNSLKLNIGVQNDPFRTFKPGFHPLFSKAEFCHISIHPQLLGRI